jgi:hypothetical protein
MRDVASGKSISTGQVPSLLGALIGNLFGADIPCTSLAAPDSTTKTTTTTQHVNRVHSQHNSEPENNGTEQLQ